MDINIGNLAEQMFNAASAIIAGKAPGIADYAKTEFEKIAERISKIGDMLAQNQLTQDDARDALEQQKIAADVALRTAAGLTTIMFQDAINAGLNVVKSTVNDAIGFALI